MSKSRGFIGVLTVVVLVIAIGVAAAWWVDQQQTAAIQAGKAGGPTDLLVEPASGKAPLSVAFSIRRDIGTVQTIDYGNGTSANVSDFICGLSYCVRRYIYDQPGRFVASYNDASGNVLRSFTITVSGE